MDDDLAMLRDPRLSLDGGYDARPPTSDGGGRLHSADKLCAKDTAVQQAVAHVQLAPCVQHRHLLAVVCPHQSFEMRPRV